MGLAGQAMGGAVAQLLFGTSAPSGKLAETWPLHLEDCPAQANFAAHPRQTAYREGLNVGYRYFATSGTPVRFAFGHGLSYTQFEYSSLRLSAPSSTVVYSTLSASSISISAPEVVSATAEMLSVTMTLTNAGDVAGSEIVQLCSNWNRTESRGPDQLVDQLEGQLEDQLDGQLEDQLEGQLGGQLVDQLVDGLLHLKRPSLVPSTVRSRMSFLLAS
jgi:hypothetical protein